MDNTSHSYACNSQEGGRCNCEGTDSPSVPTAWVDDGRDMREEIRARLEYATTSGENLDYAVNSMMELLQPKEKTKIKAADYKGKWFVLCDEIDDDDIEKKDVDVTWVIEEGLEEHVRNCFYFGIPTYLGKDESLKKKIAEVQKKQDGFEEDWSRG